MTSLAACSAPIKSCPPHHRLAARDQIAPIFLQPCGREQTLPYQRPPSRCLSPTHPPPAPLQGHKLGNLSLPPCANYPDLCLSGDLLVAGEVSAVSFTMQIETINYIQKVPQCLIFSPISLFIGICKNAGAGGLWLFRAGGWEPSSQCVRTLPIASFLLSLLILISCICNCPVESWAGSSVGAAGMGIKPFAGPGCCLGGQRAHAGVAAHGLLFPRAVFASV